MPWILLLPFLMAIAVFCILDVDEIKEDPTKNTRNLIGKVETLTEMNQQLATRNQELQETLQLAKQQIEANRVVYQDLLEQVNSSDIERDELRKQLESQRILLQALSEKLTDP